MYIDFRNQSWRSWKCMFCQHFIKRKSSCCHLYIVLCHFNIVKALLFTIKFHARLRKIGANGWRVYRELIQTEENILEQNISSLLRLFCSTTQKINVCINQRLAQSGPFFRPLPSLYVVSMVSTQDASHMAGQQRTPSYKSTPTNLYTSGITPLSRLQLGRLRWS